MLMVPLVSQDGIELVGAIQVLRDQASRCFEKTHEGLLRDFAAMAVCAINRTVRSRQQNQTQDRCVATIDAVAPSTAVHFTSHQLLCIP